MASSGRAGGGGNRPPPASPGGASGDDGLLGRLDEMFASQAASATESERAAVRRWQSTDRFYQLVQAVLRSSGDDAAAAAVAEQMTGLMARGRTSSEIVAWRGVRSSVNTFELDSGDLGPLVGSHFTARGFLATSTLRSAVEAFLVPDGPGGAVILKLTVPSGEPALWVPPLGDPSLAPQAELVLRPDRRILVERITPGMTPLVIGRVR